jgi:hypothetical protein
MRYAYGVMTYSHSTVDMLATITSSGKNVVGEGYSLACSAVTGSVVTWLDPTDTLVPSEMVSTVGDVHVLTFNPLTAAHAGTYTCRAVLGSREGSAQMAVTVQSEC